MRGRSVIWTCIAALCGVWLVCGCGGDDGDYVYLESRDAVMPVWTRGDRESGTFVVHVHGGPGNTSIGTGAGEVFDRIENRAAVTYWDQRGAGSAQGNASADSLTVEQYAADLAKTIRLVRDRHRVDTLVLLSQGFGVNVAAEYLQDRRHQRQVDGWIFVDGNYDLRMSISLSRDWIIQYANAQIEAGNETDSWEAIRAWYGDHPVIDTGDEYRQHRDHIDRADGFNRENGYQTDFWNRNVTSPHGGLAVPVNRSRTQRIFWERDGALEMRFTRQLRAVSVPTLVVWGANDGLTPLPMADTALRTLGTPDRDKRRVVLQNSAHHPELDENSRFQREIIDFIDQYR